MGKKLLQKSPSTQNQVRGHCHVSPFQLTSKYVSLRIPLAHQDTLLEETPVSLDQIGSKDLEARQPCYALHYCE